ncbi:MAG: isochorismatase [Syntrophus sp. (in: bacteria)]|nr:isochorismatase [Syntrophus sp. (in: bacteria)]
MKEAREQWVKGFFILAMLTGMALLPLHSPLAAQTIVDEWQRVVAPPAPELKPAIIDPKTTALLLLDFNKQTCNPERRPRCIASIPKVRTLLADARKKGIAVIYSLSPGAAPADIAGDLAPLAGEPVVTSGPDKFMGTNLENILKEKGVQTVIVTGTAAHGAVLYTASGAALRGIQVLLPVDGMSAENTYAEQYTAWHLANAPRVSAKVILTKIDLLK